MKYCLSVHVYQDYHKDVLSELKKNIFICQNGNIPVIYPYYNTGRVVLFSNGC